MINRMMGLVMMLAAKDHRTVEVKRDPASRYWSEKVRRKYAQRQAEMLAKPGKVQS